MTSQTGQQIITILQILQTCITQYLKKLKQWSNEICRVNKI